MLSSILLLLLISLTCALKDEPNVTVTIMRRDYWIGESLVIGSNIPKVSENGLNRAIISYYISIDNAHNGTFSLQSGHLDNMFQNQWAFADEYRYGHSELTIIAPNSTVNYTIKIDYLQAEFRSNTDTWYKFKPYVLFALIFLPLLLANIDWIKLRLVNLWFSV